MKVLFVTSELPPGPTGGAGVVVAGLADRLRVDGHDARVLLVGEGLDAPHVRVQPIGQSSFLDRSKEVADLVAAEADGGRFDLIEFQDFDGLGFWALAHRSELGLVNQRIAVRFHGPADLMFEAIGTVPPGVEVASLMESEAYRMADVVFVPSPGIAALVQQRYGLENERVRVAQPPVPDVPGFTYRRGPVPEVVCFGRLGEVKGSHDFLEAALLLLDRHRNVMIRFLGDDGWSATAARPMREWLRQRIPADKVDRIRFEDSVPRPALAPALSTAWVAVIPSRFESFNLAAHELRAMGLPIVVRDLPAFRGLLGEETGAISYDGSAAGLAALLGELIESPERLDSLAAAPLPTYADPIVPYGSELPPTRHARAQAGLATAAVKRLEALTAAPPAQPRGGRAARRLLRALPGPVAAHAVRWLPKSLKDRFRRFADWNDEAARRAEAQRRRLIRDRIEDGEFGELDDPAVSVVIPCFNQGRFIEDALLSVFAQTFESFEIVVVDDGSDDPETQAILGALDWPRTRLIRQENRGLPGARNAGMNQARGRYVVPLDADDALAPGFLAALVAALDTRPAAAFAQCYAELFGDQEAVWMPRPYNPYQLMLSNSVVGCVLLRKAAWQEVGGYDESLRTGNEDWDLWLRLAAAGWDQMLVPEVLFRYRKHGVSMSVETEAAYEHQRRLMVDRHPDLYGHIVDIKRRWYPWVSVVLPDAQAWPSLAAQTLDDVEVVTPHEGLADAVLARGWGFQEGGTDSDTIPSARGKFVMVWTAAGPVTPTLLEEMAGLLEHDPGAAAAGAGGSGPLLWRAWTLFDAEAHHERILDGRSDAGGLAPSRLLRPGCCPKQGWFVPAPLRELALPVQRQPPEEEGRLPDWITSP